MELKYDNFTFSWAVITENLVFKAKVLYIYTGVLKCKSAFSPAAVIFDE